MMDAAYNSNYHIVQAPGYVMILVEMIHDARIISARRPPTTGREHPSVDGHFARTLGRQHAGGRDDKLQREESVPRIDSEHARDRTLHAGRRRCDQVQFTIDDPSMWTRPFTAEMPMMKTIGPIFEYACHEGNYSMANALRGARADEKKRADQAVKKEPK